MTDQTDNPDTTTEPQLVPGSPESNIALVDAQKENISLDFIPEKFHKSDDPVGEWRKAYDEQAKTLTQAQQKLAEAQGGESDQTPEADSKAPVEKLKITDPEAAAELVESKLDLPALEADFKENGKLSDENRKTITDLGVPDLMIDQYFIGLKASTEQHIQQAANVVGGDEKLQGLLNWGQKNLSEDERNSLNDQLASPGWKFALLGLQQQAAASSPKAGEPQFTPGAAVETTAQQDSSVFESQAMLVAAINDDRYKTDPEYRATVEKKVQRTSITKKM